MPALTASTPAAASGGGPLRAAGKFFRRQKEKVFLRGICYGPFPPNARGEPYPEDSRLRADLAHIRSLGFSTVRVYEAPTETLLAAAADLRLDLLVSVPWTDHVDFLQTPAQRREIETRVVETVRRLRTYSCVAGFLVGNEIEKTLVRWLGPLRVQRFLERLITLARAEAPDHLFSYATYPSTEYLMPRNADFVAVNVFLEDPALLAAYLQRLQNLAGNKPLVIAEFGLDAGKNGDAAQAEALRWLAGCLRRAGAAGGVWFSYTDEWFRGGRLVADWRFGLVDAERKPRACCDVAPALSLGAKPEGPLISVIICTRDGSATLGQCLASVCQLRYAPHEVLLIDDGSSQDIAAIASAFPQVRYHRQEHAGLSVARNFGASLAAGEILAYTDDDCLVDEDWLAYLAEAFEDFQWVAAGGPNIPPAPRNQVEAVVAAAPGAPAHVLLNDAEAEHLPGCNFAVRKQALQAIGGFHAPFTTAGDDVDICWRLREAGGRLRFVPGAMVWHHRRFSIRAYLRQQSGYGKAEALLMKAHPQHFGPLGGARWRGAIYGDWARSGVPVEGAIFHGPLGNGLFQGIYSQGAACWLEWLSGLVWPGAALVCGLSGQWGLAAAVLALSFAVALCRLRHLPVSPFELAGREKALLWLLCWLQPLVRDWARVGGMIRLHAWPNWQPTLREVFIPKRPRKWTVALDEMCFWSETGAGREAWLAAFQNLLREEHLSFRADDGWRWFDVEMNPDGLVSPAVISVTEYHRDARRLTRVRLLLRLRWLLLAGCLTLLTVVILVLLRQPRYLLLTLAAAVTLLALSAILQRAAMRRCVRRAAREAGLEPLKITPSS